MPALEAFGRKWRIGSDDLVFPYCSSILLRVLWFVLVGFVLMTYDNSYKCKDEHLLKIYLFVLTGLHIAATVVEVSIVFISSRGTILNPGPRRHIRWPLYLLTLIFTIEFGWDIVGVIWGFDPSIDCHRSHGVLLLTRCVLVWNFTASVTIALYLCLRIGICQIPWCCCCDPNRKLKYESLAPEETYHGRRLSKISSETMNFHKRQRTWQWRLQWAFCCMRLRKGQRTAFADVAATLTDAFNQFRGYVPSDIAAGMALYTFHHNIKLSSNIQLRKEMDLSNHVVAKHFNRSVHFAKFSAAAYGNAAYLHSKGLVFGTMMLTRCGFCCCFGKKPRDTGSSFGVKSSCCGCDLAALKRTSGVGNEDIVFVSLKAQVFCPAFFVAIDHEEHSVVVSIRGTLSIGDLITDLSAEPEILTTCEHGDVYGHKGMMTAAHGVQLKLENEEILIRAFTTYPDYRLIIVGHSLGAGVAALLAVILKPKYPKLHCFAYSPPGCIIDRDSIPYSRAFITSVILGNDIVPRLRPESFDSLSVHVLDLLHSCTVPKYRIFIDSFFYWLGCCRPCLLRKKRLISVSTMALNKDPNLIADFDAGYTSDDIYDVVADMKLLRQKDRITGKDRLASRVKLPLYIPGRIIHVTWGEPVKKCCGLYSVEQLQAHWAAQSEFSELILEKNVINHHLPYVLLSHLQKLQTQKSTLVTAKAS